MPHRGPETIREEGKKGWAKGEKATTGKEKLVPLLLLNVVVHATHVRLANNLR